ncbi:MAG: hypothetical protein M3350_03810 [Actinomycetota bacterium]|nr:hypothetical protein [Actinomycetota bacterium]
MLTLGIVIMVASVVAGVGALTFLALKSSPARTAGRRVSTTLVPSESQQEAPYYPAAQNVRYGYTGAQTAPAQAAEAEEPPPWVLKLSLGSAAGLVLGLLLVMIGAML